MSPRPRKVSDEAIFAAVQRAMTRLGPGELTLAAIGAEAGVTAGALTQRFGSKRALLLALAAQAAAGAEPFIAGLRDTHRSPLAALRAYAECLGHLAQSPAALARTLAYLQIDLADAEFRHHLAAHARASRRGLQRLLAEAIERRELRGPLAAPALARLVETVLSGAVLSLAYEPDADPAARLRRSLDDLLLPYRRPARARRR